MADEDYDVGPGGEGGDDSQQQTPSQPQVNLDGIEDRLNRITSAISSIARDNEVRETQSRLSNAEQQIRTRLGQSEAAVTLAERRVAEAYESGDAAQIARAQRNMTEAIATREGVKADVREFDRIKRDMETRKAQQPSQRQQNAEPEGAKDTRNLNDWKSRNSSWYGVDVDMTKAAHEVDKTIREAGVIPVGSQEYFKAIDRQMAQRYPDKMRSTPSTAGGGSGQPATPQRQTGRIPQSVIDSWGRMGINVSDDKVLQRMIRNQEALVAKGILPQERQYGAVMTR